MLKIESLKTKFSNLADEIEKYIDIDRIIEISETEEVESKFDIRDFIEKNKLENKTIAIAYDKGFNFYYRENIELLEDLGLNIKYFSPLNDKEVPISDYIYIGGGFPEIFANEIELNKSMRESIRNAHEKKHSNIC